MGMTNYRPVSVLSYFAKIMEKAMCDRLTGYINKINVLYPSMGLEQAILQIWH